MEIKQIYELVNAVTTETLGEHAVLTEDLSNVVDIGKEIFNANSVDRYVRSLVDHIGKVIFVNRPYTGTAPSVLRDGWEYGAVCEKIMAQMPKATENESWELEDGVSYDPNIFYKPEVSAKFFNKRTTWEIPLSFTEMQVRGSFSSASQMNGFLSMLHTSVENSKSIKTSDMIMRTINSMIAATFYNLSSGGTYTGTSGIRCVNLLYLYNQANTGHEIYDTATAIKTPEFIRFAAYIMGLYKDRLKKMSTLFNIGGQPRFTSSDRFFCLSLKRRLRFIFSLTFITTLWSNCLKQKLFRSGRVAVLITHLPVRARFRLLFRLVLVKPLLLLLQAVFSVSCSTAKHSVFAMSVSV